MEKNKDTNFIKNNIYKNLKQTEDIKICLNCSKSKCKGTCSLIKKIRQKDEII